MPFTDPLAPFTDSALSAPRPAAGTAACFVGVLMRSTFFITAVVFAFGLAGPASVASAQSRSPDIDLDAVFAAVAPTGPGCAAGVARPGQAVLRGAWGMADLEHPAPLTPDSVFESGSLAKQFTAAAVLLLVQDGRLGLDDDIRLYLPEMPDYGTPITLRHLLTHTSGLREQWSLLALAGNPPGTQVHGQATILDLASRQTGLNFTPGTEFLYTNTNYALAAILIERVSGQSLQAFTDARLFAPLGMGHTRWREDFRTVVPGRATAYAPDAGGFIANMPFTSVYGNGGLLTTVDDLLRWNAFLDHPSDLPGGARLVAALQTPGRLSDGTVLDYALGLELSREHGRRLVAHSGSTAGYKTWLGRYPEAGVSVAVLCNNGGINPIALGEDLAARALKAQGLAVEDAAPPAPAVPPSASIDPAPYQGLFRNPITGELVQTALADGGLTLIQGGRPQALAPVGAGAFQRADGAQVRVILAGPGAAELVLERAGSRTRYRAVRPPLEGPTALEAYVGVYYSSELDTRVTVVREGDALVARQAFGVAWRMTPRFADAFAIPLRGVTILVFSRGADGQVDGFGAWANGARDIVFLRQ